MDCLGALPTGEDEKRAPQHSVASSTNRNDEFCLADLSKLA
jgi:hypothetical protein